jgi:hypothetical protein
MILFLTYFIIATLNSGDTLPTTTAIQPASNVQQVQGVEYYQPAYNIAPTRYTLQGSSMQDLPAYTLHVGNE